MKEPATPTDAYKSMIVDQFNKIYFSGGLGTMIRSTVTMNAIAAFAAKNPSVIVADASCEIVCEAVRQALDVKTTISATVDDIAKGLKGKFLIVTGVHACDEMQLDGIKEIAAKGDGPVVVVLNDTQHNHEYIVHVLYNRLLADARKSGGAE